MNNSKKECIKRFCPTFKAKTLKLFDKLIKKENKTKKINAKEMKFIQNIVNKMISKEVCEQKYCNPGCKGTIYEAGKSVPKSLIDKYKKNKKLGQIMIPLLTLRRKRVFGNKTNVLRNGFYEKWPPAEVKKAKNSGAISACEEFVSEKEAEKQLGFKL